MDHGYHFELFSRDYLAKRGINVMLYNEFNEREAYGLPIIDKGADLIGVTADTITLVQAKYRSDTKHVLTYGSDKLAHLEAMGYRASKTTLPVRLIITTTVAKCTGVSPDIIVYGELMQEYQAWLDLQPPAMPLDLQPPAMPPLRDYQRDMLGLVTATHTECALVMPTGSGKTRVFLEALRSVHATRIVVAPTLALCAQIAGLMGVTPTVLNSEGYVGSDTWYVTTYASIRRIAETPAPRYIVLDEAHNLSVDDRQWLLNTDNRLLHCTATPNTRMDDIPIAGEYTLENAVNAGYLVNYSLGIIIDRPEHADTENVSIVCSGILHAINYLGRRKIILYCRDVVTATTYYRVLRDTPYWCGIITAATRDRETTLAEYSASEIGILVNVRVLREGIDLPCIDCVVFSSEKHSRVDILQCMGRGLRVYPGKQECMVLARQSVNLDSLMDVVRNHMPGFSAARVFGLNIDREYLVDPDGVIISLVTDTWLANYNLLQNYITTHSKLPAQRCVVNGSKIGKWIDNQRQVYKKGKLSQNKITQLEGLAYWRWDASSPGNKYNWNDYFNAVKVYAIENGTLPVQSCILGDIKIGKWIGIQRQAYKKSTLSPDKITQLESLPNWHWGSSAPGRKYGWDDYYNAVKLYITQNGTLPKKGCTVSDIKIGTWINTQRTSYKRGKLSQDRTLQLESLPGWRWDAMDYAQVNNWMRVYRLHKKGAMKGGQLNHWSYWNKQQKTLPPMRAALLHCLKRTPPYNAEDIMNFIATMDLKLPRAELLKNPRFLNIFAGYQGDLFDSALQAQLTAAFASNPQLAYITG